MPGGTHWIWVRHAAAATQGSFCGQSDPPLGETNAQEFIRAAQRIPSLSPVFVSPLRRARETLERMIQNGFKPGTILSSPLLAEQNFGVLEGQPYDQIRLPDSAEALADWRPENGESFADVVARVGDFLRYAETGQNSVCVIAHAGVIRAALAIALDLAPARALSIAIDPLSATAMTRWADANWQIRYVNRSAAEP